MSSIKIIAAIGTGRLLGIKKADGSFHLPWSIPEDMKHFTHMTTGGTVIMGRTTWESIPGKFRPLPNRINIILTRNPSYEVNAIDTYICTDIHSAFEKAKEINRPIWIIGGASIYEQALPFTDELILTRVSEDYLPPMELEEPILFPIFEDTFTCVEKTTRNASTKNNIPFWFETWKKK